MRQDQMSIISVIVHFVLQGLAGGIELFIFIYHLRHSTDY